MFICSNCAKIVNPDNQLCPRCGVSLQQYPPIDSNNEELQKAAAIQQLVINNNMHEELKKLDEIRKWVVFLGKVTLFGLIFNFILGLIQLFFG